MDRIIGFIKKFKVLSVPLMVSILLVREVLEIIKEHFVLLLGAGLFIYGLFDFDSDYVCGEGESMKYLSGLPDLSGLPERLKCIDPATYYYYDHDTLILLTIGAILIVIGLLKIKKEGGKLNQK